MLLLSLGSSLARGSGLAGLKMMSSAASGAAQLSTKVSLGAGCYWGTEKFIKKDFNKIVPGSIKAGAVGFMNPDPNAPPNPTYRQVCGGKTGYVEVYDCEFDGKEDTFEKLMKHFFTFHDASTLNRQGNDAGFPCTSSRSSSSSGTQLFGFRSSAAGLWRRIRGKRVGSSRSEEQLKSGIAKFYDESSAIWLDVWGEDMHHGYYVTGKENHKEAQVDMIDRSLAFAYASEGENAPRVLPKSMVDVGCGVGGSSRHIAKKYGCTGKGISLSPYQIERANEFTRAAKLDSKLEYRVADAMAMPFANDSFDLTWSMESGEHMPDKRKFVGELARVTAPGGRIIIVTWCHRELKQGESSLEPRELRLLDKINDAYYLPDWVPASDYLTICKDLQLEDIRTDDWSEFIAPFWPAVFRSALVPKNFIRMMRTGMTTFKGAIATLYMLRGFQKGIVKFALITAKKSA